MGEPADAVRLVDVRAAELSIDEVFAAVSGPSVGGVAVFVGTVRDEDAGRPVRSLEYEAHPDATARMRQVAESVAASRDVISIAAVHRIGMLQVGDLAVVVAAACGHRHEAFAAGQELIDRIKAEVPIWKRQTFLDGDVEWVGISEGSH